jgi:uncharacterized membrane protein YcaP (DUF421 family)
MDVVLRAIFGFLFLFLLTRVVGRRELSTMEPFDVILLVVLGDLVQQGITQSDYSITGLVLVAGTMGVMTVIVSYLAFRFRRLRPVLHGEPIVLVQDGEPLLANLKRERITTEELAASARFQAQLESIRDAKWAILERNGQISWIRKEPATG